MYLPSLSNPNGRSASRWIQGHCRLDPERWTAPETLVHTADLPAAPVAVKRPGTQCTTLPGGIRAEAVSPE